MSKCTNIYKTVGKTAVMICGENRVLFDASFINDVKMHQWNVGSNGYVSSGAGKKQILLHRYLTGAKDAEYVDHSNGNTLDNRISNLRCCSATQNNFNRGAQPNGTSGYKGVSLSPSGGWQAQIVNNGKAIWLGRYDTPELAANAYDSAAVLIAGEFARLNCPDIPLRPHIFEELRDFRRPGWLTDDEKRQIVSLLSAGVGKKEIARRLSRSYDTVLRFSQGQTHVSTRGNKGRRRHDDNAHI